MRILACTDGSEQSQKALKEAARIAENQANPHVTVIYVDNKKPYIPSWAMGWAREQGYSREELRKRVRELEEEIKEEEREKIFSEAEEIFKEKGLSIHRIVKEGPAATNIVEFAKEKNYDLVVLGNRGLGGLKKLFPGSVSNVVAHEVDTSVLIVK